MKNKKSKQAKEDDEHFEKMIYMAYMDNTFVIKKGLSDKGKNKIIDLKDRKIDFYPHTFQFCGNKITLTGYDGGWGPVVEIETKSGDKFSVTCAEM